MHPPGTFVTLATDSGLVAGILHVSPVFIRRGPRRRGEFPAARAARARRSDARNGARSAAAALPREDFPVRR